ncbi:unnamed protein product [Dovyalis caffra]|uniref:Uncharacterized protein n=1 Tax=Dovyalis caffra TaxID=77055 RepID=A0AAV1R8E8_9ROSI|nr:unnamed protein product [Dovyalis caffra]
MAMATFTSIRLRDLKQLGCAYGLSSVVHSTFEHSLGVYWLAGEAVQMLKKYLGLELVIDKFDIQTVKLLGLLQDVGHESEEDCVGPVRLPFGSFHMDVYGVWSRHDQYLSWHSCKSEYCGVHLQRDLFRACKELRGFTSFKLRPESKRGRTEFLQISSSFIATVPYKEGQSTALNGTGLQAFLCRKKDSGNSNSVSLETQVQQCSIEVDEEDHLEGHPVKSGLDLLG